MAICVCDGPQDQWGDCLPECFDDSDEWDAEDYERFILDAYAASAEFAAKQEELDNA